MLSHPHMPCAFERGLLFRPRPKVGMSLGSQKRTYNVEVEFQNGLTRNVKVKAADRDKAEQKALRFHPSAIRVKKADVA